MTAVLAGSFVKFPLTGGSHAGLQPGEIVLGVREADIFQPGIVALSEGKENVSEVFLVNACPAVYGRHGHSVAAQCGDIRCQRLDIVVALAFQAKKRVRVRTCFNHAAGPVHVKHFVSFQQIAYSHLFHIIVGKNNVPQSDSYGQLGMIRFVNSAVSVFHEKGSVIFFRQIVQLVFVCHYGLLSEKESYGAIVHAVFVFFPYNKKMSGKRPLIIRKQQNDNADEKGTQSADQHGKQSHDAFYGVPRVFVFP